MNYDRRLSPASRACMIQHSTTWGSALRASPPGFMLTPAFAG